MKKKRLRQLLYPLRVYVDKFMNLQLVTQEKLNTSKRKTLIDVIFPTAKLKW